MARVLLVSVVYEPDTVSTSGIVAGLARGLRDLGHDVSVLSSVPHYSPSPEVRADRHYRTGVLRPWRSADEDGIRVVRCYVPQKRGRVLGRALDFAVLHATLTVAALRMFRRSQVTIVVSPPLTFAFVAFVLRGVGGTKVVYNAQELWPDVPRDLGVITSPALLRLLSGLERFIYRRSDAVTPIGERFAEVIRARGARPDRVVVIPNFVDSGWITPRPRDNALREEWRLGRRPVVLYAGNVGRTQDFELVLEAADHLPGVEFVIVGGGAGLADLRQLHARRRPPNVQLRPFQPTGRVADLYGLADVVIVPLRPGHDRTTTPSKIFSAMAAGRPVVACAAPDTDLADELARSSAGTAVPTDDLGAFLGAIGRALAGRPDGWDRERALDAAARHSARVAARSYDDVIRAFVIPAPAGVSVRTSSPCEGAAITLPSSSMTRQ